MLQRLEAVPMHALLQERTDRPLDQTVLLGAVRRDELLAQPVASDQRRKAAAGEDQAIVRTQQEWLGHTAQRAEARSGPAPALTPRSSICRCGTGASSATRGCGSR